MATNQSPVMKHTESTDGTRSHKDYTVRSVNLLSGGIGNTIDLKHMMVELSYFEDIYSHAASGKILISDAVGVIEKAQLHGNEYIRISFGKDSDDSADLYIDKLFRVYKIDARSKMDNDQAEVYTIHFCSDELLLSSQSRVSKSYPNSTIKSIITDVLVNYLKVPSDKYNDDNIEQTLGTYSLIVPNFSPFEAIQWLTTYARPMVGQGSDMLFFENAKQGYVLASMQTLFKQNPFCTFSFGAKNLPTESYDNLNDYYFNVQSYTYDKNFDVMKGIHNGTFANRLISLDIMQHVVNITDYNYNTSSANSSTLNKNTVVNNLSNRFGNALYETPDSLLRLSISNSNQYDNPFIAQNPGSVQPDAFIEDYLTNRKSQLSVNNYTRLKLVVAGNPTLSVGTTVIFNINSNTPDTQKEYDKFYSGKYLISAIRHTIQNGGYNTVLELIKDSNNKPYSNVDNSAQIWKNTVAGVKK